jgi:hypothetical protein
MRTHFASTLHAVRKMTPHVTVPAVVPGSSVPAPVLPKPAPKKSAPPRRHESSQVMVLPDGECLTIVDSSGKPLLEILSGDKGPTIRLAQDDLRIECPGQLDLAAEAITMEASEDVTLRGKTIRLN